MISVMLYFVHYRRIFIPQSNKDYLEKKHQEQSLRFPFERKML